MTGVGETVGTLFPTAMRYYPHAVDFYKIIRHGEDYLSITGVKSQRREGRNVREPESTVSSWRLQKFRAQSALLVLSSQYCHPALAPRPPGPPLNTRGPLQSACALSAMHRGQATNEPNDRGYRLIGTDGSPPQNIVEPSKPQMARS
jgi:hypothetical protein